MPKRPLRLGRSPGPAVPVVRRSEACAGPTGASGKRVAAQAIVGVDTGGTFTDLVVYWRGELRVHKVLSTPDDPARAVLQGLAELLPEVAPAQLTYSSTVATNALLERRGARVLLLTTSGFEDILEIGRQNRPHLYALHPRRVPPLVDRSWRVGVRERMEFDGRPSLRLASREVRRTLELVRRRKPRAVAVCFLHSYVNPEHEQKLAQALQREFPDLFVSASHALVAEQREYERFSTAVINAYVGPVMRAHIERLDRQLSARGVRLRVLQSNAGAISASLAAREAVRTCLSGPAGGVRGAAVVAKELGLDRVVTFDMGGTSTDVSLIDTRVSSTSEWWIGGLPLKVPSVDVHTVGAGGGSIAYVDEGGALKVGPQSAGANPGPACYGRGTRPTVTDANLVLGRLVPGWFLAGRMALFPERARAALEPLAQALRIRVLDAALGVVRVANATMERAVRRISVERGYEVRNFALLAFGGAAGQHACELAEELGISQVVIPSHPGLLSAWGAARAPLQRDGVRSIHREEVSLEELEPAFGELVRELQDELERVGVPRRAQRIERSVDVRYVGQSYELTVPARAHYRSLFERMHRRLYGYADPQRRVEVVNIRVSVRVPAPAVRMRESFSPPPPEGTTCGWQRVYAGGTWHDVPVWERTSLPRGRSLLGPALVVEMSGTTWLAPGWCAEVSEGGHLILRRA